MKIVPKSINKQYVVKINNQPVFTSQRRKETFDYVAKINLNDAVKEVKIVRENLTESVIKILVPKVTTILVAGQLEFDLEGEETNG